MKTPIFKIHKFITVLEIRSKIGNLSGADANERAVVAMNIKRFWNYDKKQINHGKVKEIMKLSTASGVTCGKTVVNDIARGKDALASRKRVQDSARWSTSSHRNRHLLVIV